MPCHRPFTPIRTAALLDSSSPFRHLAESAADLVWVSDRQGRLAYVNPSWSDFVGPGAALDQEEGRPQWWEPAISPADHERWARQWSEARAQGRAFELQVWMRRKDGQLRPFEMRVVPVLEGGDGEAEVTCWLGICAPVEAPGRRELDDREIEAALAEARYDAECFRRVADAAPVILWIIDADYECVFVNRGWCEFTGQTEEEALGYGWREMIHPEDRDEMGASFRARASEAAAYQGEFRLRSAGGGYRWVASSARPRSGAGGSAAGYIGSLIDIHEEKLTRQELRRTTDLLQAVLAATPDLVYARDLEGRVILANQATLDTLNRPAAEVIGHTIHELFEDPGDRDLILESDARVRASGEAEVVEEHLTTPQERRVFLSAKSLLRDDRGEVVGLVGISRDVTARQRDEDALRQREAMFRDLADNIAPLAWMANPDGVVFWYNRRWSQFTGMRAEAMMDRGWMDVLHPDHVERVGAKISHCLATGQSWEDLYPLRADDGTYRWFLSRAVPIYGEDRKVARWFGTSTDVTEQHQIEESLTEADRRKDDFLATLAHELRNPLAPIRHALELIRMREPDDPELLELVDIIDRQSKTLVRLVDDLLEVSRIARGKIQLRCAPVRVADFVANAVEAASPGVEARDHRLHVDLPVEDVWVEGDSTRLAQVMTNLLNNAAKYTPSGGDIWLSAQVEGTQVWLRVRDNGIGISAQGQARVFDLFSQVGTMDDHVAGGLGIGLALVRALVVMHGGSVEAHSEGEGQGSEFVVRLPLGRPIAGAPL